MGLHQRAFERGDAPGNPTGSAQHSSGCAPHCLLLACVMCSCAAQWTVNFKLGLGNPKTQNAYRPGGPVPQQAAASSGSSAGRHQPAPAGRGPPAMEALTVTRWPATNDGLGGMHPPVPPRAPVARLCSTHKSTSTAALQSQSLIRICPPVQLRAPAGRCGGPGSPDREHPCPASPCVLREQQARGCVRASTGVPSRLGFFSMGTGRVATPQGTPLHRPQATGLRRALHSSPGFL